MAMTYNHNEAALRGMSLNHNEAALRGIVLNHNETALDSAGSHGCLGQAWNNHNESVRAS